VTATAPPLSDIRVPTFDRLLIVALALLAGFIPVVQFGRVHPDEVFQYLEPAFERVHGYGVRTWEWDEGLRNIAAVAPLTWLLKGLALAGVTDPRICRAAVAVPLVALHAWALLAAYRMAARDLGARAGPRFVVLAVGLCGQVLLMAGRTLSESLSASLLLIAFELLSRTRESVRIAAQTGVVLGLAVVARYGSVVLVPVAAIWLAMHRRWKTLAVGMAAGIAVMLALGLLDYFTWGQPWHSLAEYVKFNIFSEGAAARFGASPWWFYGEHILRMIPIWALVTWLWAPRRGAWQLPLIAAVVYLVIIMTTAHKETRFLYPALLLIVGTSATGLWLLAQRLSVGPRRALLGFAIVLGLPSYYGRESLVSDLYESQYALTRPADVTGLLVVGAGIVESGGYFHIGRHIALKAFEHPVTGLSESLKDPVYNRAISVGKTNLPELLAAGFVVMGEDDHCTLLRRDVPPAR
jgi:phosphatidylinositol glycan class B